MNSLITSDLSQIIYVIISVCVLVSLSFTLISCLWFKSFFSRCCPGSTFKDLENEDAFFSDIAISTVPSVNFQMYPPVVNSTYNNVYSNNNSVYFEPLPDLTNKQRKSNNNCVNESQLRPKIAHINFKVPQDSLEFELRRKLDYIHGSRHNTFSRSQLQYIKELGTSWFGKVLQGEGNDIQPGKKKSKVVVMMCHDDVSLREKYLFLHEATAYKELDSRNVLKLYCQCVESSPYLTILESCMLGDLKSFMKNQKSNMEKMLDNDAILNMICDVVAGLQAIHQINFTHRDLSMRNCLITNDLIVKIGDYGLAEQKYKDDYYFDADGVGIPIRWMAPESLSLSEANLKVDDITKEANIWSFGVLMWEMLRCGDLPYPDLSDQHVLRLVVMEKEVKLTKPLVANDNVRYFYELMEMCWCYDSEDRPSTRELRISLLHLSSNKHQADRKAFDEKWNQLKPKPLQMVSQSQQNLGPNIVESAQNLFHPQTRTSKSGGGDDNSGDFEIISKNDVIGPLNDEDADNPDDDDDEKLVGANNEKISMWFNQSDGIHSMNNQSGNQLFDNQSGDLSTDQSQITIDATFTSAADELSPMDPMHENSLLKMEKYTNYLNTVTTSLENEDSFVSNNKNNSNK